MSALSRLNGICPYFTMFPLAFPERQLRRATSGDWVLDPFCGRGTTNYAARLLGLPSVGIDTSPVAVAIASAKLVSVEADTVVDLARAVVLSSEPTDVPQSEFWRCCYHGETLANICKLREHLSSDSSQ